MTAQSLQINLSGSGSSAQDERIFVNLSQREETGMDKTASMYDISQMIARAKSGKSASTYKKDECSASVTATGVDIAIPFEAWPSAADLGHTIESSLGYVSPATVIEEFTEFSRTFKVSDTIELDFILADISSYHWETNCYTASGERLTVLPKITMDGLNTVRCSEEVFGVVRIKGKKIGARHTITHSLITSYPVRPDEPIPEEGITADDLAGYWAYTDIATWNGETVDENETIDMTGLSIDNLSITVTAKWFDGEEKSQQMKLAIPQCIQDLLATCDGNLEDFGGGSHSGTTFCDLSDRPEQLTVYISGCTKTVLEERLTREDPDSWCKE